MRAQNGGAVTKKRQRSCLTEVLWEVARVGIGYQSFLALALTKDLFTNKTYDWDRLSGWLSCDKISLLCGVSQGLSKQRQQYAMT